jgi:L-asparaginase type II
MSAEVCVPRRHLVVAALAVLVVAGARPGLAQTSRSLPTVYVLSTGGTIAGRGATPTDLASYRSGTILGEDLVNAVPRIKEIATIRVEQIANVGSGEITLEHWLVLARRINTIFDEDRRAAGVIVTHGTNTLEETAYFLNLTVKDPRPVVVVGAMRPATAISADGPLNLLNAVRTVIAPEARGKGVLIVLNDEINAARDTTKTNTYRVETFRAPELGVLGYVDDDKVSFYRASTRRHTEHSEFDVSRIAKLPKVEIAYSYVEPDPAVLRALVEGGAEGIVLAGTGAGGITTSQRTALRDAVAAAPGQKPVLVRASRVGNGRVIASPQDEALSMIPADTLNPQKARILLMLALTKTHDPKEIRRMFAEY